ncbi:hypothetical protein [Rhodococcus daqingensis]|uniref:Uncharacterized protein n=1 Tax=Rhodococcus daqingensis TaxID=2479363 RepID=A0ABW2S1B1_9NOCA
MNAMNTSASTASGTGGSMSTEEIKAHIDGMFASGARPSRRRVRGLHKLNETLAA